MAVRDAGGIPPGRGLARGDGTFERTARVHQTTARTKSNNGLTATIGKSWFIH